MYYYSKQKGKWSHLDEVNAGRKSQNFQFISYGFYKMQLSEIFRPRLGSAELANGVAPPGGMPPHRPDPFDLQVKMTSIKI